MGSEERTHAVKLKVLFFGPLAEQFETRELEFPLPRGSTIRDLANRLEIGRMLERGTKVALNGEFCSADTEIPDAAEVAFLPPVSGG